MEVDEITNSFEFKNFVDDLIQQYSMTERTMGEYLRAMLVEVRKHEKDIVTYRLLAHIIKTAYAIEPVPFEKEWLRVKRPNWTWNEDTQSYAIKKYDETNKVWVIQEQDVDPFYILECTLLEQIAERYLLEDAPDSLTETQRRHLRNDWSNPDPYPYLQTAMYVLYGDASDGVVQKNGSGNLDWTELAAILSIGQVYD